MSNSKLDEIKNSDNFIGIVEYIKQEIENSNYCFMEKSYLSQYINPEDITTDQFAELISSSNEKWIMEYVGGRGYAYYTY